MILSKTQILFKLIEIKLLLVISLLFLMNCKSEEDPYNYDNNDTIQTTALKIDETEKALYSISGQRFIELTLTSNRKEYLNEIFMNSGIEYRIVISNLNTDLLKMQLLNQDGTLLEYDENIDMGHSRVAFNYHCKESMNHHLLIDYKLPVNEDSLTFKLSIEEVGTKLLNINEAFWLADGDWRITGEGHLQFIGFESFLYKWIKIPISSFNNFNITVQENDNSANSSMFYGIAISETSDIYNMINLPEKGIFYKVKKTGESELWNIDVNETGIDIDSKKTGNSSSQDSISMNISDSVYFQKDSMILFSTPIPFYSGYLYLIVEDTEMDTITFPNIIMNNWNF